MLRYDFSPLLAVRNGHSSFCHVALFLSISLTLFLFSLSFSFFIRNNMLTVFWERKSKSLFMNVINMKHHGQVIEQDVFWWCVVCLWTFRLRWEHLAYNRRFRSIFYVSFIFPVSVVWVLVGMDNSNYIYIRCYIAHFLNIKIWISLVSSGIKMVVLRQHSSDAAQEINTNNTYICWLDSNAYSTLQTWIIFEWWCDTSIFCVKLHSLLPCAIVVTNGAHEAKRQRWCQHYAINELNMYGMGPSVEGRCPFVDY